MKIKELSLLTGHTPETIRYYERIGLIAPAHRELNNYRHYNQSHVDSLFFINHCRKLDIGLDEIRALLEAMNAPPECQQTCAHATIERHIRLVNQRIKEMQALRKQLVAVADRCKGEHQHSEGRCGIIDVLEGKVPLP